MGFRPRQVADSRMGLERFRDGRRSFKVREFPRYGTARTRTEESIHLGRGAIGHDIARRIRGIWHKVLRHDQILKTGGSFVACHWTARAEAESPVDESRFGCGGRRLGIQLWMNCVDIELDLWRRDCPWLMR